MFRSFSFSPTLVRRAVSSAICVVLCAMLAAVAFPVSQAQASGETVNAWLTTADLSTHLARQADLNFRAGSGTDPTTISIDDNSTYQRMVGFGASFTDGSSWLVYDKMSASQRNTLMTNLFDPGRGIGLDFLRQPMGASDLSLPSSGEYSYDDVPAGQTDPSLSHFSIAHDSAYIIPVLKQALRINPAIKIMATPWSPPGWMKSTDSMEGGTLNTSAYGPYANYFVKFIQAYRAQGIPIYAVTPQNEPLYTPVGYPGMSMPAADQTNFIKSSLGPAFTRNHLSTRILAYDHNWDQPGYPSTVFSDATASAYTPGVAWHCYGGDVSAQTQVHDNYPGKEVYQTECSGGTWENGNGFQNTVELLINVTRNWGQSVVRWGMALDPNHGPNLGTGNSCQTCRGIVTVDQSTGNVTYNSDYYGLGHASKFVEQGAYRIFSSSGSNGLEDVAFKNPDGSKVLVAYNSAASSQTFDVQWGGRYFRYTLPAGAAVTFKWHGTQSARVAMLNRAGWKASASSTPTDPCCTGDVPANILDGNPSTRWSTGAAQANGQWLQIDMGAPRRFNGIILDAFNSGGDYPRSYQVFVSNDGANWGNAIVSGNGSQYTVIAFARQTARYIKIVQTGSAGNWWSVHELNVYAV